MTLKRYLIAMTVSTIGCWMAFATVLFCINPEDSGFIGPISFFFSLFLALLGTFSLIGFFFRTLFHKEDLPHYHLGISFRQAFFLSILLDGSLILLGTGLFLWWSIMILLGGLIILEFFFLSKNSKHYSHEHHRRTERASNGSHTGA